MPRHVQRYIFVPAASSSSARAAVVVAGHGACVYGRCRLCPACAEEWGKGLGTRGRRGGRFRSWQATTARIQGSVLGAACAVYVCVARAVCLCLAIRSMKFSSLGDREQTESMKQNDATNDHTPRHTKHTHRIVRPSLDAATPCCFCAGAWLVVGAALLCLAHHQPPPPLLLRVILTTCHRPAFHTIHRAHTTTKHHASTRPPPRLPAPAPRLLPVADGASPGTFLAKV